MSQYQRPAAGKTPYFQIAQLSHPKRCPAGDRDTYISRKYAICCRSQHPSAGQCEAGNILQSEAIVWVLSACVRYRCVPITTGSAVHRSSRCGIQVKHDRTRNRILCGARSRGEYLIIRIQHLVGVYIALQRSTGVYFPHAAGAGKNGDCGWNR